MEADRLFETSTGNPARSARATAHRPNKESSLVHTQRSYGGSSRRPDPRPARAGEARPEDLREAVLELAREAAQDSLVRYVWAAAVARRLGVKRDQVEPVLYELYRSRLLIRFKGGNGGPYKYKLPTAK
jgi:hypothetical protein